MARIAYFIRETVISLRRNLLMTFAGIITVMISLLLFGAILLVSRFVDHGTAKWKQGVELEIFMDLPASAEQVADVRASLADNPMVKRFKFLNHQDAMREFRKIFRDQPALVENTRPEDLPESFRVVPARAELTANIKIDYESKVGVDTVITAQEAVDRLLALTRWIRIIFTAMATALLLSSLFLIVNTIRLATFARRREIEVMKLVGASNWFIRIPFMAEGLVQGAVGAGIAFGLVYWLKVLIADAVSTTKGLFQTFYVTNADALTVGLIVMVIGAGIGMVGSSVGLRRFLET